MGFAGTGVDEIEISLRGSIDQDMVGAFAEAGWTDVLAVSAKLMDEIMKDRTGGTACAVKFGTAESVERVDVKMILQELAGRFRLKAVAFVNHAVRQRAEFGGLVIGDKQLGGGNA